MKPEHPEPIIVVEHLRAEFGDNLVFKDVSFQVNRGEIFVILGGSGCGKTTLLKHIVGLYRPTAGRVLVHGVDIVTAGPEAHAAGAHGNRACSFSPGPCSAP